MSFESHKALCNLPGFPDGSVVKNLPANAGDVRDLGSVSEMGRAPGGREGNPLQYSCLGNPMDRGVWWAAVCGVTQSWTWLKWLSMCVQGSQFPFSILTLYKPCCLFRSWTSAWLLLPRLFFVIWMICFARCWRMLLALARLHSLVIMWKRHWYYGCGVSFLASHSIGISTAS